VVIEKRDSVSLITRCCCQLLIMDENFSGETLKYEKDKIVFTQNKFSVDYNGPTLNVTDKYYISPSGHKIQFAYKDRRPIVIKIRQRVAPAAALGNNVNSKGLYSETPRLPMMSTTVVKRLKLN